MGKQRAVYLRAVFSVKLLAILTTIFKILEACLDLQRGFRHLFRIRVVTERRTNLLWQFYLTVLFAASVRFDSDRQE